MIYDAASVDWVSESYLLVEVADELSLAASARLLAVREALADLPLCPGVVEVCLAAAQLAVVTSPTLANRGDLEAEVRSRIAQPSALERIRSRRVWIPVWYDDPWSAEAARAHGVQRNIDAVAETNGIARGEVAEWHSACEYWTLLVGSQPGACDAMPLDHVRAISAPKYANPRIHTPARAVGVGGLSTCVYPLDAPGGYQLIGRAAIETYDRRCEDPAFTRGVLLQPGDRLQFQPVSELEYGRIRAQRDAGTYRYEVEEAEIDITRILGTGGHDG